MKTREKNNIEKKMLLAWRKHRSPELAQILSAACQQLIIKNPILLDTCQLSRNAKEEIMKVLKEKEIPEKISISETVIDIKDKTEGHKEGIRNMYLWLASLSLDDFKKIYELLLVLCDKNGDVKTGTVNRILKKIVH